MRPVDPSSVGSENSHAYKELEGENNLAGAHNRHATLQASGWLDTSGYVDPAKVKVLTLTLKGRAAELEVGDWNSYTESDNGAVLAVSRRFALSGAPRCAAIAMKMLPLATKVGFLILV